MTFVTERELVSPPTATPDVASGCHRVLHVSACDDFGGSGKAAYRIHQGLKRLGWHSQMLVTRQVTNDPDVAPIWRTTSGRLMDRCCGLITGWFGLQDVFYPSSFRLPTHPWFQDAEVVTLYNIHGGCFGYLALRRLSALRPVVWRLSDMWAFTGHCAYSYTCDRWKTGCGSCPFLSEPPALRRDTTALLWRIKQHAYRHCRVTLVVPSGWMAERVKQSPLLQQFTLRIIPNGVDLHTFRPLDKAVARQRLQLSPQTRVLLFSAHAIDEPRKGLALLRRSLEILQERGFHDPVTVLVVGAGTMPWQQVGSFRVSQLGFVGDDPTLALAYGAADAFVLPTVADNLPNSLIESLACAVPVVTCNVGGCGEVIRHLETGYLAAAQDPADLAQGIQLLLQNNEQRQRMATRCREVAEGAYGLELQARRYAELYRDCVARWIAGPAKNGH